MVLDKTFTLGFKKIVIVTFMNQQKKHVGILLKRFIYRNYILNLLDYHSGFKIFNYYDKLILHE